MAFVGRKLVLVLSILCLQCAVNVSGFDIDCYACTHETKTGKEADCGKGKTLPCNNVADLEKILKQSGDFSRGSSRRNSELVDIKYTCVTKTATSKKDGSITTTRSCVREDLPEDCRKESSSPDFEYTCIACEGTINGKPCNGGKNPPGPGAAGSGRSQLFGGHLNAILVGVLCLVGLYCAHAVKISSHQ